MFSRRTNSAAHAKMMMVTGIAMMVRMNSALNVEDDTMTRNWTVNPRKKKKSNFNRAM